MVGKKKCPHCLDFCYAACHSCKICGYLFIDKKGFMVRIMRMIETEFSENQNEILKFIPEQFHGALSKMAWDSGHAYGYEEVLIHLSDLVEGLKKPIQEYKKSLVDKG